MVKKKRDILIANSIFFFHFILVGIVAIGWLFPQLFYVYVTVLVLILSSWMLFGHCLFTKWEFDLRRKYNPKLSYDDATCDDEYIMYYIQKFFRINVSGTLIHRLALATVLVLLVVAIIGRFH
jgi:hypothetical protein